MKLATTEADQVGLDLAGYAKHRAVAGIGGGECCRSVEQSGSRHHEAGAKATSYPGIAIGHIGSGLLVSRMEHPNPVRIDCVVEGVEGAIELNAR